MYSYGSPHMAAQKQDDQLERTFSSYVRIQAVVLKTYLGRWTIGRSGERGSGISVLPAQYDDDEIFLIHINGEHVKYFTLENRLTCLNTKFKKIKGKLWIYTYANNTKAQIDYVYINKKWNNCTFNCVVYSSFEGVSSDHRIVTAKI